MFDVSFRCIKICVHFFGVAFRCLELDALASCVIALPFVDVRSQRTHFVKWNFSLFLIELWLCTTLDFSFNFFFFSVFVTSFQVFSSALRWKQLWLWLHSHIIIFVYFLHLRNKSSRFCFLLFLSFAVMKFSRVYSFETKKFNDFFSEAGN